MAFSKDLFLIPYYVAKMESLDMEFVYNVNDGGRKIPLSYRNATLIEVVKRNELLTMLRYIVLKASLIDVLFMHGSSTMHMLAIRLYKLFNKKGKVIVFGDMELPQAQEMNKTDFLCPRGLKGVVKRILVDFMMKNSAYIVANTEAYEEMKDLCDRKGWTGLLHFYPCIDDEKFNEYGMTRKTMAEKDNVMVCVGRIGCHQKNTEMLLDALEKVDIKDWKIYMLGPVTSSFDLNEKGNFQRTIDAFFERNPQYRDKLIFKGMVTDQSEMFEYYNNAKVLLMTSRHESWGNVYSEAAALGCYIISTEVGGARLCSNNWQYGTKVGQEDANGLAKVLRELVAGKIQIDETKSLALEQLSYTRLTKDILLRKLKDE